MPRGQNEAFKAQQGKGGFAASVEKAREAGRKGGKAKTMTMHDFKRMAQELNAEQTDKGMSRGQVMLNNLQNEFLLLLVQLLNGFLMTLFNLGPKLHCGKYL